MASSIQSDSQRLLTENSARVDAYLNDALARLAGNTAPSRLIESIRYSLLAGGKRLRPTLVLESFRACRRDRYTDDLPRSVLAAAGAIELIHTFSLVHDDLPAMDDDDLRRGRPTNHKVFGEAMAILAGDAMMTLAFELIATDADAAPALVRELSAAAGPTGMIGGQALDMAGQNASLSFDQLASMHRMKTGALITCACRMGAITADASREQLDALTRYGSHLGLAFQIADDLLDVTATAEQLGKHTRKDQDRGKNTYPALLGLQGARDEAARQLADALAAINDLGAAGEKLRVSARFVVERDR